ncbi:MAG TPA: hypothetical protein VG457_10725 [Planctomycetota bacterium]|jgi:hypothetical protein|nr:hypothetical protein [Planctomycetota bacterium]
MGDDKKKGGGGGYKWGSALIWTAGQWAVCWFVTEDTLLATISACVSAFFAGWTTSALLGRFARWGANPWVMMILGVLVGVAVFSGAFSGIRTALEWWNTKNLKVDWDKLQAFLLSWSVVPPAALGLLTGLYVRANTPKGGKK